MAPSQRHALDFASVMALAGPLLAPRAFRTASDRVPLSDEDGRRGRARVYVVQYNFPTLVDADELRPGARLLFDTGGFDYPFCPPPVQAIGWVPWLPHVAKPSGMVCIGTSWAGRRGQYTLGDLVLHCARILNADEPETRDAFDLETIEYLDSRYGGGPITRGLALPVVPPELVHGTVDVATGSFQRLARVVRTSAGSFRRAAPPTGSFRRIART